jgi:hypothetical protein
MTVLDLHARLEKRLNDPREAAGGEAEAKPAGPITGDSASSTDPSLRTLEGGRVALEKELMLAAAFCKPTFVPLLRQLTPSANDSW